jgi:cell division protein FtsB
MARLKALEKRQDQDQVKIEALQNEVATYRQIVRALKRRVTELEHDKPPSKRSRTSSSYSGNY